MTEATVNIILAAGVTLMIGLGALILVLIASGGGDNDV